jgi:hypothetical protein
MLDPRRLFLRSLRSGGIALAAALSVATVLAARPAGANGGLRCGNRLVNVGDRIDEVFRRCGEPTFRSFSIESVSVETAPGLFVTRQVQVETWTVNRGPRTFIRYLTFRDGRLVRVDEGDYGY